MESLLIDCNFLCKNINLTTHDSNNIDTRTDRIMQQDMDDMIEAVEELLFHAEMMSTNSPLPGLTKSDIITFRSLAGKLYTEALNIQQITRKHDLNTYDYELLDVNYHRLNQTCATCHKIFRDREVNK